MKPIYQQLQTQPQCFDFFQAVRLLEDLYQQSVGKIDEPVSFYHKPKFGFAVTDIAAASVPMEAPALLTVNFFGVLSPQGLLPAHYTEYLIHLLHTKNTLLLEFIQLLEQRSIGFFYRAWRKYHCFQEENKVSGMLNGLVGCGLTQQQNCLEIPDNFYIYYANHFMKGMPTTTGLEQLLTDYFATAIRVKPLQGEWLTLPPEQCSRLSQVGAYNRLGVDIALGGRVWQCQNKFRLLIGPLETEQLQAFLPTGRALKLLKKIVRRMIGAQFQFDIQLIVKAAAVRGWQLGSHSKNQLGWTSWISNKPFTTDVDHLILQETSYEYA